MNKINISEPLNISLMTIPEGSIPAHSQQTRQDCSHVHAPMQRCTRTHEQTHDGRTGTPKPTQAHVARKAHEHKIDE